MDEVFVIRIAFRTFKFRASKGDLTMHVSPFLSFFYFPIDYFLFDFAHLMSQGYILGLKIHSLLILIQSRNKYCEILKNLRESLTYISFSITHSIPQVAGKGGRCGEREGT